MKTYRFVILVIALAAAVITAVVIEDEGPEQKTHVRQAGEGQGLRINTP